MNASLARATLPHQTECRTQCDLQFARAFRELHVAFEISQGQISPEQAARIKAWRCEWTTPPNKLDVVFGGATHTSRIGKLRRLYGLMTLLAQLGIATKRIFPDVAWTQPVRMGSLDDMPADTIWLRLYPHTRRSLAI